jgi:alpha-ribazole phosphatase
MTTRLLLVRHGQTAWNADGRFMGQMDIPLNDKGLLQSEAVGRRLAMERPQAIYTSDLQRARQTAEQIHQAIAESLAPDPPPPLVIDPRLREMSFGEWEGFNYQQIEADQPEALRAWEEDFQSYTPRGGENAAQMFERVFAAHVQISERHPEATVILVAHGGSLQALLTHLLGLPIDRMWQFHMSNTGLSEVNLYSAGAVLNLFNDTCHLEGVR